MTTETQNLTIKQEVTAIVANIVKNDNAKNTFFSQALKRIREAGDNEQLQGAITTAIDSEIKTAKASDNNKKVAKNILTTAGNYHGLKILTKFDLLEYNNVHAIVSLITKLSLTKGDTVGYQAENHGAIVQVDKALAIETIQTAISLVFQSETLKALKGDEKALHYNNLMNENVTALAKKYGKKVAEEEITKSYLEEFEEGMTKFLKVATIHDLEMEAKKLNLALANAKEKEKQLKTKDVA